MMLHGFAGGGHWAPLVGPEYMLGLVAVGAWSAQLGGRARIAVGASVVLALSLAAMRGSVSHGACVLATYAALYVAGLVTALLVREREGGRQSRGATRK
jgi:urease accessory protein